MTIKPGMTITLTEDHTVQEDGYSFVLPYGTPVQVIEVVGTYEEDEDDTLAIDVYYSATVTVRNDGDTTGELDYDATVSNTATIDYRP